MSHDKKQNISSSLSKCGDKNMAVEQQVVVNVLLVGGFGDGQGVGTTHHVQRKLKKWCKSQTDIKVKLKAVYFGTSSVCGQSLRFMASSIRKKLHCSIQNPYRGIVYGYSMGSLLVKMGVLEGWIDPCAICFCCGAHLGIYAHKGSLFEKIYWPSDKIRGVLGLQPGAVHSIRNDTFTSNLEDRFGRWMNDHQPVCVLFVGNVGDRLVPIESSVPETIRNHPQAHHLIYPKKKHDGPPHINFPCSKKGMKVITTFIEKNARNDSTYIQYTPKD
mmetsp:Transcript_23169/g.35734  ORF Transcript_23169/g.35734 Transcript_23169/m.35734 type:complete len:273 (-) Transcript_23169:3206-4024(-)